MASPVLRSHNAFKAPQKVTYGQGSSQQPLFTPPGQQAPQGPQYGQSYQQPQYGQPYQQAQYGQPSPYQQQGQQNYDSAQLNQMYQAPAASPVDTGRMSYDDVIMRTGAMLGTIVVVGAITWFTVPGLFIVGAIVGLVLGLVNAFKREPSVGLIMAYAVAQGVFLGGISAFFETMYPGIVIQAVLASGVTFGVTLALYKSKKIQVTPKFQRGVLIALLGYGAFCLVNFGLMLFAGDQFGAFGLRSVEVNIPVIGTVPLGALIGVLAVILAAMSLVIDFDMIDRGVKAGVPVRYSWTAAFGLTVTLVWLYLEFLRLLAIFRD